MNTLTLRSAPALSAESVRSSLAGLLRAHLAYDLMSSAHLVRRVSAGREHVFDCLYTAEEFGGCSCDKCDALDLEIARAETRVTRDAYAARIREVRREIHRLRRVVSDDARREHMDKILMHIRHIHVLHPKSGDPREAPKVHQLGPVIV